MTRKPGDPAPGIRPRREAPAKWKRLEAGTEDKRPPNGSGWKPVPKTSVRHPEVGWKPVDGGKRPQSWSRAMRGEFLFQVVV